jgi:hypothetical protein
LDGRVRIAQHASRLRDWLYRASRAAIAAGDRHAGRWKPDPDARIRNHLCDSFP